MNMRGMSRVQRAKAGALPLGCALGAMLVASPARAQDPTEVAARVGAYQDEPTTTVSLSEALNRAAGVDPDYVAALRRVGDSEWVRRSSSRNSASWDRIPCSMVGGSST
jgi:hypothetical protein